MSDFKNELDELTSKVTNLIKEYDVNIVLFVLQVIMTKIAIERIRHKKTFLKLMDLLWDTSSNEEK